MKAPRTPVEGALKGPLAGAVDRAEQLLRDGLACAEVARLTGLSRHAVWSLARSVTVDEAGELPELAPPPPAPPPPAQIRITPLRPALPDLSGCAPSVVKAVGALVAAGLEVSRERGGWSVDLGERIEESTLLRLAASKGKWEGAGA